MYVADAAATSGSANDRAIFARDGATSGLAGLLPGDAHVCDGHARTPEGLRGTRDSVGSDRAHKAALPSVLHPAAEHSLPLQARNREIDNPILDTILGIECDAIAPQSLLADTLHDRDVEISWRRQHRRQLQQQVQRRWRKRRFAPPQRSELPQN